MLLPQLNLVERMEELISLPLKTFLFLLENRSVTNRFQVNVKLRNVVILRVFPRHRAVPGRMWIQFYSKDVLGLRERRKFRIPLELNWRDSVGFRDRKVNLAGNNGCMSCCILLRNGFDMTLFDNKIMFVVGYLNGG